MTQRPLTQPGARLLNHLELVYAPGERPLARALLEGLGFRVLDPQTDPIPPNLGPAAAPFLIVYMNPKDDDVIDNILYAAEVREDQWRFEQALQARLEEDEQLAALHQGLQRAYATTPQLMTHFGVAYPTAEELDEAMGTLASNSDLKDRITLSNVVRPGGPDAVDDRVVQGFVYTDIVSAGLLCAGQQIELQVRLDGV